MIYVRIELIQVYSPEGHQWHHRSGQGKILSDLSEVISEARAWANPADRLGGGAATGGGPNLAYPQIRISPRISATLFWKSENFKINYRIIFLLLKPFHLRGQIVLSESLGGMTPCPPLDPTMSTRCWWQAHKLRMKRHDLVSVTRVRHLNLSLTYPRSGQRHPRSPGQIIFGQIIELRSVSSKVKLGHKR